MQLKSLTAQLPKPCTILIVGARGSGKDVLAHDIARALYDSGNGPIYIDFKPDEYDLPKYYHQWMSEWSNGSIYLLSDAHLRMYARTWRTDDNMTFDKLITISRHKNICFIFTTQETRRLDVNIVAAVDAVCFKEPSLLAQNFERPEIRQLTEEAAEVFKDKTQRQKWQTAYVVTRSGKHTVDDVELPYYWSEDLSKRYGDAEFQTSQEEKQTVIKLRQG